MSLSQAVILLGALAGWAAEPAQPVDLKAGRKLAEVHCGGCHSVGPRGKSPRPNAPAFRDLHERYPIEHLEEALAEGISVGHPEMPSVMLEGSDLSNFLAYLQSLQPTKTRPGP